MTRDELRGLLGGYATGTLTEAEQAALFAAALEDQDLFDELMREQGLKELLDSPGVRTRLLAALKPETEWWQRRWVLGLGMAAAGLVIAIVLWPRPEAVQIAQVRVEDAAPLAAPPAPIVSDSKAPESKTVQRQAAKPAALADEKDSRSGPAAISQPEPTAAPAPPPAQPAASAPLNAPVAAEVRVAEANKESAVSNEVARDAAPPPAARSVATAAGGVVGGVVGGVPGGAPAPAPLAARPRGNFVAPTAFTYVLTANSVRITAAVDGVLEQPLRRSVRAGETVELPGLDVMVVFTRGPAGAEAEKDTVAKTATANAQPVVDAVAANGRVLWPPGATRIRVRFGR
jgi:hypothetical protein